jgi:hypothetical protein
MPIFSNKNPADNKSEVSEQITNQMDEQRTYLFIIVANKDKTSDSLASGTFLA